MTTNTPASTSKGSGGEPYLGQLQISQSDTPGYQYKALPEGEYIRLIELLAGAFTDEIRCELFVVKLSQAPPFEAISYVWGDPNDRKDITCSAQRLRITTNLFGALQRFRNQTRSRILWADAICINQGDLNERARQVRIMGNIYSQATTVLIWLGEDNDNDAELAFQLIRDINAHFGSEYRKINEEVREKALGRGFYRELISHLSSPPDGSPLLDFSLWLQCKNLLDFSWFSRVWVCRLCHPIYSIFY
jgi:Heterokaryon incompatibility protein (HET)